MKQYYIVEAGACKPGKTIWANSINSAVLKWAQEDPMGSPGLRQLGFTYVFVFQERTDRSEERRAMGQYRVQADVSYSCEAVS